MRELRVGDLPDSSSEWVGLLAPERELDQAILCDEGLKLRLKLRLKLCLMLEEVRRVRPRVWLPVEWPVQVPCGA